LTGHRTDNRYTQPRLRQDDLPRPSEVVWTPGTGWGRPGGAASGEARQGDEPGADGGEGKGAGLSARTGHSATRTTAATSNPIPERPGNWSSLLPFRGP
jgi:hypothetical protein